jgi:hypothetical protein
MSDSQRLTVRTPAGLRLTATHDHGRDRWRVEPGGYERRDLRDALAQASGSSRDAAWISSVVDRIAPTRTTDDLTAS